MEQLGPLKATDFYLISGELYLIGKYNMMNNQKYILYGISLVFVELKVFSFCVILSRI